MNQHLEVSIDGCTASLLVRTRIGIGTELPRVWYHVGTTVHASRELQLFHRQRTLLLGHDHTGASELADIRWTRSDVPLATQARTLHALLQATLEKIAGERAEHAERLIVELPGVRDAAGQSPFWASLGRHFYDGDPADADALHGPAWRSHVATLLPRQPIYASFLAESAQAAIAQVQPEVLALRDVLEEIGLRYSHHVNVEDAGPVLDASVDDLLRQGHG